MKENLSNQSKNFEDVALNVGTIKTQNLELLLDDVDFAKFLSMEDLSIMNYSKPCNANSEGFEGAKIARVSSRYLLKSYHKINCITNLSVILKFATPAGGLEVHKGTSSTAKKWVKSAVLTKILNSDFYLYPC